MVQAAAFACVKETGTQENKRQGHVERVTAGQGLALDVPLQQQTRIRLLLELSLVAAVIKNQL